MGYFAYCMPPLLAVGEPPHCLSCSALFAVKRAIEDARKDGENFDFFPLGKVDNWLVVAIAIQMNRLHKANQNRHFSLVSM